MTCPFTHELVRRMQPALQNKYALPGALPLDIKLHLERLKLAELVRKSGDLGREVRAVAHTELAVAV
jgi:hypothetical protein